MIPVRERKPAKSRMVESFLAFAPINHFELGNDRGLYPTVGA